MEQATRTKYREKKALLCLSSTNTLTILSTRRVWLAPGRKGCLCLPVCHECGTITHIYVLHIHIPYIYICTMYDVHCTSYPYYTYNSCTCMMSVGCLSYDGWKYFTGTMQSPLLLCQIKRHAEAERAYWQVGGPLHPLLIFARRPNTHGTRSLFAGTLSNNSYQLCAVCFVSTSIIHSTRCCFDERGATAGVSGTELSMASAHASPHGLHGACGMARHENTHTRRRRRSFVRCLHVARYMFVLVGIIHFWILLLCHCGASGGHFAQTRFWLGCEYTRHARVIGWNEVG